MIIDEREKKTPAGNVSLQELTKSANVMTPAHAIWGHDDGQG